MTGELVVANVCGHRGQWAAEVAGRPVCWPCAQGLLRAQAVQALAAAGSPPGDDPATWPVRL